MGLNNTMIGMWAITHCDRAEEAENYLSRALLENVSRLFTMTMGFLTLYEKQKRWNEAREPGALDACHLRRTGSGG